MIALKCAYCGQQVQVGDREVRCPRCGQPVSSKSATEDSKTFVAKPRSISDSNPASEATQKESNEGDTIAGHPSRPMESFAFLSPPKEPKDLGALAHYRIVRLLGQGGMGIVFEAIDTQLQRTVALKVMKPDIAQDELARQRFVREARMTASVKSDHIVVIHEVGEHANLPYLAMEFLYGEPLDSWLERFGRPPLEVTLRIALEIAHGLVAAHALGLIHRDIKPSNIWLESSGPAGTNSGHHARTRVKILDFGLARVARDQAHLTHSGLVLGTPAYMAPEQAEGGDVDPRCDLFSLGCVLYELGTGAKPFSGTNTMAVLMSVAMKDPLPPAQLNPDLPPALADLILRLLAKKPEDRPGSAQAVVDSVESLANQLGLRGQTPTSGILRTNQARLQTMTAGAVPPRRSRLVRAAAILGGLLAIGLLTAALLFALLGTAEPDILLGMSGPLNGPSKELGRDMELGIKIYARYINEQGGVHGRKLKLVALDDGYEPDRALANMKELHVQRKVFAVIGNIGTPTALETVPYAIKNKILFFGAFTGAKVLRNNPPDRYVFNYRASYEEETAKIVEYLVEIRNPKVRPDQIAVFAQEDGYGDAGFAGVAKVMRKKYQRAEKDILRVGYDRNKLNVEKAVAEILQHPDLRAVVMVGTYRPVTEFIKQVKNANRDLLFTNVSFVGSEALADGLKELGEKYTTGVIVTQVVPPTESSATLVLKYHELRTKYFPGERASFTSLEGYISTALFVEGLKRAGPHPTVEKLIDTLETISDLDLGIGATLHFSASEHQASHRVWATVLDKDGHYKVLDMTE